jgi:hypothetical protein
MLFREAIGRLDHGLVLLPPTLFLFRPHLFGQGFLKERRQVQARRLRLCEELRIDGEIDRLLYHAHKLCALVMRSKPARGVLLEIQGMNIFLNIFDKWRALAIMLSEGTARGIARGQR